MQSLIIYLSTAVSTALARVKAKQPDASTQHLSHVEGRG